MAKRISQHRAYDYFELGEFMRKQKNKESPETQQLIDSRAESLKIPPNARNLTLATRFAIRFNREQIQKLLDLRVAGSDRPLSFEHFVALAAIDNHAAMEHMAQGAATLGLDPRQFREHINRNLHDKTSRRPQSGRSRRKFGSPLIALMFCRDQLEALNSALDDLEHNLTTEDQHRQCVALRKAFQRASTVLKPLATSCNVELDDSPRRPRRNGDATGGLL